MIFARRALIPVGLLLTCLLGTPPLASTQPSISDIGKTGLMVAFIGPCSVEAAKQAARAAIRFQRYALFRTKDKRRVVLFTSERQSERILLEFRVRCPQVLIASHDLLGGGTGGQFALTDQWMAVATVKSAYGAVGHEAVDEALRTLERRVRSLTRSLMTITRLGADRVLLVGPPKLIAKKRNLFAPVPPDLTFVINDDILLEALDCVC